MQTSTNNNFMEKFASRMFKRAEGVVWDLTTGMVGIQTESGIATMTGTGEDAEVSVNMFDQFAMEVPAFAQSTPVSDVKVGDMIYYGVRGNKAGWITERVEKKLTAAQAKAGSTPGVSFKLLQPDGQTTSWKAPNVRMLGFGDAGAGGVMVIRSLGNLLPGGDAGLGGLQGSIMSMMQMQAMMGGGDLDMESVMPFMLMGQMGGGAGGGGNMMQTMMLMKMMGGKGDSNPMSAMFGGGGNKSSNPFHKG